MTHPCGSGFYQTPPPRAAENQAPNSSSTSFFKVEANSIFSEILKKAFSLRSRPQSEVIATCQEIRQSVQTLITFTVPLIEKIKAKELELRKKLDNASNAYKASCTQYKDAKANLQTSEEKLVKLRNKASECRKGIQDLTSEIEKYREQIRSEKLKRRDGLIDLIPGVGLGRFFWTGSLSHAVPFYSSISAIISLASKNVEVAQRQLVVKNESLGKIKLKLYQIFQDKKNTRDSIEKIKQEKLLLLNENLKIEKIRSESIRKLTSIKSAKRIMISILSTYLNFSEDSPQFFSNLKNEYQITNFINDIVKVQSEFILSTDVDLFELQNFSIVPINHELIETNLRIKSIAVVMDRIQREKDDAEKKLAAALVEIERMKSTFAKESPDQLKIRIKIKKVMKIFLCNKPIEAMTELEILCPHSKEKILLIYDAMIKPLIGRKYDSSMAGNVFFRRSWKNFDKNHEWRNCAVFLYLFKLTLKNTVYKFKLHSYLPKKLEDALIRGISLYEGIAKGDKTQAEDLLYTDPLHPNIFEVIKLIRKNGLTVVSKLECEVICNLQNTLTEISELTPQKFSELYFKLSELMQKLIESRAKKIHESLAHSHELGVKEITAIYFKEVIEALCLEFNNFEIK